MPTQTYTPQKIWEALDEIDATGELYQQSDLVEHLYQEGLIQPAREGEGDFEMTNAGGEFYDRGYPE